ncbi:uncharacterized protein LOC130667670 [Microplitis mediator]|uniref:uncharacterized protein LOC130667670 n=1 Tax=Microplitis mediator TaxID=375433 RepID=UPI0025563D4C|nr:uncharacterized protein LOC130667670 [Microplitis mediator]
MEKDKVKTFNSVIQAINNLNQQSSCVGKRILKYISSRLSIDEELIKRPLSEILKAYEEFGILERDHKGKYKLNDIGSPSVGLGSRPPGCNCPDCVGKCGYCPTRTGKVAKRKSGKKKCSHCGRGRWLAEQRRKRKRKRLERKKNKNKRIERRSRK